MQLTDFARKVPDGVWALFEPILPPVVWCGNGCPPYDNRTCLNAVLSVLATGIRWQMLPLGVPSYKTVQRRLKVWLQHDAWSAIPAVGGVVRDPNDDMVIACALAAGVSYLVTRDPDLLTLKSYRDVKMISPEEFMGVLREENDK